MLLSKILSYLAKEGLFYQISENNLIDTEIDNISIVSKSNKNSVLFFDSNEKVKKYLSNGWNLLGNYGVCFIPFSVNYNQKNIIQVSNPRLVIILIANLLKPYFEFLQYIRKPDISKQTQIKDTTIIKNNTVVNDCVFVGEYCFIDSNCAIGIEGMSTEWYKNRLIKFPHFSDVFIDDDVFISSNVVIARGCLTPTVIKKGCRINSHSYIAHGCEIGENTEISINVTICGSVKIGNNCRLAPGCIINDHIEIPNNTFVAMGSVVTKSIDKENMMLIGNPARIFPKEF